MLTQTKKTSQNIINNKPFPFQIKPTDNKIGYAGAISLSDALKSNTKLAKLNLCGKDKKKQHKNDTHQHSTLSVLIKLSDNIIGETGATSFSDALKSNTTLTKLDLSGEHKETHTQMTSINNSLFSILIQ